MTKEKEKPPTRPETGPMKFGDDWCGVFIRGDNAAYFSMQIELCLEHIPDSLPKFILENLKDTLSRSLYNENDNQQLKPFEECREVEQQSVKEE